MSALAIRSSFPASRRPSQAPSTGQGETDNLECQDRHFHMNLNKSRGELVMLRSVIHIVVALHYQRRHLRPVHGFIIGLIIGILPMLFAVAFGHEKAVADVLRAF